MSQQTFVQALRQALHQDEHDVATALLVGAILDVGYLPTAHWFEDSGMLHSAPGCWSSALAAIAGTYQAALIQNAIHNPKAHCHVVGVTPDVDQQLVPYFTYSVGLSYNLNFPEIICFGLQPQTAAVLINQIAGWVAAGRAVPLDTSIAELAANDYQMQLRPTHQQAKADYTPLATWFYGHQKYALVQLVWQGENHCWPWEEGFYPAQAQPLLF